MVVVGVLKPRPEDAPEFRLCVSQRFGAKVYAACGCEGRDAMRAWLQESAAHVSARARAVYEKENLCK